jgi:fluoride exporter
MAQSLFLITPMDSPILTPILISLGAVSGALSRYYLTLAYTQKLGTGFPYATFIVNLSGAFLIGVFATLFERMGAPSSLSLLVIVGFLGSYTTFSTYGLDTSNLLRTNNYKKALLYWVGSPALGLLCVKIGTALAQQL